MEACLFDTMFHALENCAVGPTQGLPGGSCGSTSADFNQLDDHATVSISAGSYHGLCATLPCDVDGWLQAHQLVGQGQVEGQAPENGF